MGTITCGPKGSTTQEIFDAVNAAQVKGWEATAHEMTAKSYATEPVGTKAKIYTSNGDGTFNHSDSPDFSALHYESKAKQEETNAASSASGAASSATTATTAATSATGSATSASTSSTNAQKEAWIAEAWKKTANSYASEPKNIFVKIYTSNNDGTFSHTDATTYSSLHYEEAAKANAKVDIFQKPTRGALFVKTAPDGFKVPSGTKIDIDGIVVSLSADVPMSLSSDLDTGTKIAGTDYYVYAKQDGTFYISANKNITSTDLLIGGFHYGLVPEAEAKTGNKTDADMVAIRGINQYSFWDLKFRPIANQEGMVYINGKWYDIYLLNSEHITNGTSKAGATIAGGAVDANARAVPKIPLEYGGDGTTNYGAFKWYHATEVGQSHSKRLISNEEFMGIAYGVLEQKSSQTDGYEVVAGKIEHYPELTSKFGIEQATGTQFIWGSDMGADAAASGYQATTEGRGSIYGTSTSPKAVLLGANRGYGVNAGSRASSWVYCVWDSGWGVGSRFTCCHLELV